MFTGFNRQCIKGGRYQYYYYYHCSGQCGCWHKAEDVNKLFFKELKKYAPKPGVAEICKKVILDVHETDFAIRGDGRKEILDRINELNKKQKNARELLLKGDLDGVEYREIKFECETKINAFEAKLTDLSKDRVSIESGLNRAIKALTSINGMCDLKYMKLSRELIGSMYPEKFPLEKLQHRTARVNEVASVIF